MESSSGLGTTLAQQNNNQNPQSTGALSQASSLGNVQSTANSLQGSSLNGVNVSSVTLAPTVPLAKPVAAVLPKPTGFHPSLLIVIVAVVLVLSVLGGLVFSGDKSTTNS